MNIKMEKFINFKQLDVVKTGAGDTPTGVQLKDATALFTQLVLPNAIVWDKTTNAAAGGQMYIVTAVTSDTELALTAIGPTASQGTGVPNLATYNIYMPEFTVRQSGTADGTATNQLVDSGVNFITAGVKPGDYALDITAGVTAKVTAVNVTTLTVDTDTFAGGDTYLIYADGADDHDKMLRAADIALIENNATAANNSRVDLTYDSTTASVADVVYAYSDTILGVETMRNAIQDAAMEALKTSWTNPVFEMTGVKNPYDSGTNDTWLGGRNYFILRVQ
tara:strand:- start:209 stop:1045 length:837 start_codon:yes stop_codon:yes gene_type:complete